ncbi:LysR family transcriptional regulator [Mannheimia sp. USDA-ARS-USMARC-1261]|uniref:LysR family transcriptional regulator n=1 Tax=Mannheimia sp. USDA-ARS-USMARC-1261 TaxID=1432056 RepID=UPI001F245E25|nr:LysR family transcriptional regulator [Mannheimia sp. USDA-ARS-USMARC-1261]
MLETLNSIIFMQNLNDLRTFVLVVEQKSFTKAGEKLGISASAVSHCVSNLEDRLNIRLLNRTTRSVSPTPDGLTLLNDISPYLQAIDLSVQKLTENQDTPKGTVRINASQIAIEMVVLPKIAPILSQYPQIQLELHSENRFVDIVGEGFDMGVRLGDDVAKDMVAVKISQPLTATLVATPNYLQNKEIPKQINELDHHRLIGLRLGADRNPIAWDFCVQGKTVSYQPEGQLILNTDPMPAIKNHLGIGFMPYFMVEKELKSGELIEILGELRITYEPFYAYYPSRKHHSKAFEVVLNALRE